MKRLIAANWKMNLGPHQAELLIHRLNEHAEVPSNVEVVLCPPFIDIQIAAKTIDKKKFKIGAQNIHFLDEGPFTGEVSAPMLSGLAEYTIVGHSERRRFAHEDDKTIALKLAAAVRNGLKPILCVGETMVERQHDLSTKVVVDQLTAGLAQLTAGDLDDLVVAYEPVWALSDGHGHGVHAKPEEVDFIFRALRQTLESLYGEAAGSGVRFLYGGSSDPDHSKTYLEIEGVSGLLVGGASLNYASFAKIIAAAGE